MYDLVKSDKIGPKYVEVILKKKYKQLYFAIYIIYIQKVCPIKHISAPNSAKKSMNKMWKNILFKLLCIYTEL